MPDSSILKEESQHLLPLSLNDVSDVNIDDADWHTGILGESNHTTETISLQDRFHNLFQFQRHEDLDKAYPFKVNSLIVDERTFRFPYPPKNGLGKLVKYILDKIHYATHDSTDHVFSLGYFDDSGELITMTSDEDLLECVHSFNLNNKLSKDILLMAYKIEDHSQIVKEIKGKKQRQLNIARAICLLVFFFYLPLTFYFS